MNKPSSILSLIFLALCLCVTACNPADQTTQKETKTQTETAKKETKAADQAPAIKTNFGVDLEKKVIRVGALNDESGPAAIIAKPYAVGKRVLVAEVNAGESGLLPKGWTIQLVEKDHGYNPSKSQQALAAIKDDVLFLATSFGTPTTLPLRPFLEKDQIIAFAASLSSEMAKFEQTPPIGAPYTVEAHRAMDFAVKQAGGAAKVKAGIIYDQSDYGKDGLAGWKEAAKLHNVKLVAERAIKPGQKDFTAEVSALKAAGATHILLTVLPSSSGPILGTAAKMRFMPTWIGNTPAWVDVFFAHPKLPAAVFSNFYWISGMPFWGENLPSMSKFIASYTKHGKDLHRPDFYMLVSYIQGRVAVEALKRAIESKDLTREGFRKALRSIENFDVDGLVKPMSLKNFPYATSDQTRILKPDFAKKTWTVVEDYASPMTEAFKPAVVAPPVKAKAKAKKRMKAIKKIKASKKRKKNKKNKK